MITTVIEVEILKPYLRDDWFSFIVCQVRLHYTQPFKSELAQLFSTEYNGPTDTCFEPVPAAEIPTAIRNKYKDHVFLRPLQLTGLTLTNAHNNKGQRAITITNRQHAGAQNTFAGSGEPADSTPNQTIPNKKMKTVCTLLGLSAEADEQSVHAAVTKLQNRVTELTPLADENTKLKNRLTALDSEAVDTILAAHGVKEEKVLNRLKPVIAALPTLAERETALVDFGFKKVESKPAPAARVLNRGSAAGTAAEAAPIDEQAKVEKIRNRCSELTKNGVKFDTAWAQAVAEANK